VSSTKRTPDESGRGSVATGPHAEPKDGDGSVPGAANGAGNGRAGEPPQPAATADDPATVNGSDIVPSGAGAAVAGGPPPGTSSEASTAQFTVPADKGRPGAGSSGVGPSGVGSSGAGSPSAGPSGAGSSGAPVPDQHLPTPADGVPAQARPSVEPATPTLAAVPAPAVPAPGPGAAQPPPWRRMGGHDGGRPDGQQSTADRLLDDGPTAFLEAPRFSPPPAEPRDASTDTGSWARIPRSRPPRQAALQLKRLDPWSVLKLALVLAVVLFFIWLVAVGVLYGVLDGMGVWDRLNGTYADLVSGEAQTGNTLISAGRVFGLAAVVGAINSLLFAVAVTVGAFVYNVSADLVGGIEVTLSERD
jgi:hypothetical protein